jgi:hypothetical protein
MEYTEKTTIVITAKAGSMIGDCIREAFITAMEEYVRVELLHNGNSYFIDARKMVSDAQKKNGC